MNRQLGLTGCDGWIGRPLCQWLEEAGHAVRALDDWTRADARPDVGTCPEPLDWVLHLGAKTSIEDSWADPFAFYTENLRGTLAALELARSRRAAFLYLSSYVYGPPQSLPIDESHPAAPTNPYMASKLLGEQACRTIASQEDLNCVILRAFNIYGPGLKPGRLISDLLAQACAGGPLRLNDPSPRRDYLFINDFCELIQKIITHPQPESGVFNVGSGESHTNAEVAAVISELAGGLPIEVAGQPRPADIDDCTMTPAKARQAFGWIPTHTLRQGLATLLGAQVETP